MKKFLIASVLSFGCMSQGMADEASAPVVAGGMEFIDMGTSVMWATKPLGITESSPYGSLYLCGAPEAYSTPSGLPSSGAELTEWGGDPKYDASTVACGHNVHTPSKAEFEELMKVCTVEYKYDYSKMRYVVTITSKETGNVLQATGAGYISFGNDHGSSGELYFYSSTIKGVDDYNVQGYCFSPQKAVLQGIENAMLLQSYAASNAYQILPVYDPNRDVKIEKIKLSAVTMTLGIGEGSQLGATVEPENATNKKVEWTTSDESVATVDADGLVEAVGQGSCEIVATAADGSGIRATCAISVMAPTPDMEFVDLGLSVLWGKYDLGASSVSEKGVYYAWGTLDNADNYLGATAEAYNMRPDGPCTGVLRDPDDPTKPYDVATELLGGDWRTPTKAEWQELVDNTTVTRETVDGVTSACFTSKINGNAVFMGGFGYIRETSEQPQMSTSVIRQTSDAPNDLIYDTKYVVFPAVRDMARYCYWLVPIRPVCSNPLAAVGSIAVDKKSDGLFDVYDVSGRFAGGRLTYSEARERLPKGVYVFVGSDGHHYKVAF